MIALAPVTVLPPSQLDWVILSSAAISVSGHIKFNMFQSMALLSYC